MFGLVNSLLDFVNDVSINSCKILLKVGLSYLKQGNVQIINIIFFLLMTRTLGSYKIISGEFIIVIVFFERILSKNGFTRFVSKSFLG